MFRYQDSPHLHAITALRQLLGNKVELKNPGWRIPGWAKLTDRKLLLTAGDNDHILDFTTLRPLAIKEQCDVVATYLDRSKIDHPYQFDLVLTRHNKTTIYEDYRLWMASGGACYFIPEAGDGPVISAMTLRLSLVKRPPFCRPADRLIGITRGQAELHTRILGASSARS